MTKFDKAYKDALVKKWRKEKKKKDTTTVKDNSKSPATKGGILGSKEDGSHSVPLGVES